MIRLNKGISENQFDIIPNIAIYIHSHSGTIHIWDWSNKSEYPFHFHIHVMFFAWYIELQIGKDFIDGDTI
jgi:hypothetical protein